MLRRRRHGGRWVTLLPRPSFELTSLPAVADLADEPPDAHPQRPITVRGESWRFLPSQPQPRPHFPALSAGAIPFVHCPAAVGTAVGAGRHQPINGDAPSAGHDWMERGLTGSHFAGTFERIISTGRAATRRARLSGARGAFLRAELVATPLRQTLNLVVLEIAKWQYLGPISGRVFPVTY